jgi:hypothetical protein
MGRTRVRSAPTIVSHLIRYIRFFRQEKRRPGGRGIRTGELFFHAKAGGWFASVVSVVLVVPPVAAWENASRAFETRGQGELISEIRLIRRQRPRRGLPWVSIARRRVPFCYRGPADKAGGVFCQPGRKFSGQTGIFLSVPLPHQDTDNQRTAAPTPQPRQPLTSARWVRTPADFLHSF